jgi:acyl-CoA synthetase (AMP-forming)/AMP-acid ligase II
VRDGRLHTGDVGSFAADGYLTLRDRSKEDLDRTCLDHIARFERPKHYRRVDSLPTNNYGKVLKRQLRDRLRADAEEDGSG